MKDARFTISEEYTGRPTIQYVVRFCGGFLKSCDTRLEAAKYRDEAMLRHLNMLQNAQ